MCSCHLGKDTCELSCVSDSSSASSILKSLLYWDAIVTIDMISVVVVISSTVAVLVSVMASGTVFSIIGTVGCSGEAAEHSKGK